MGCRFLLQGISPTQGLTPSLLCLLNWQAGSVPLSHQGSPNCPQTAPFLHYKKIHLKKRTPYSRGSEPKKTHLTSASGVGGVVGEGERAGEGSWPRPHPLPEEGHSSLHSPGAQGWGRWEDACLQTSCGSIWEPLADRCTGVRLQKDQPERLARGA